jgi:hypothetical protein
VTRADVITSLISQGLFNGLWDLDDMNYESLSWQFVTEARAAWLETLPAELVAWRELGLSGKVVKTVKWLPEVFDCDNIARDFGVYLARCMAAKAVREDKALGNVAAGKLNFQPTPTTAHAINWFIDHNGRANTYDAGADILNPLSAADARTVSNGETI